MRHAPGSALALACGILALVLFWLPQLTLVLGGLALFNGWRARRTARKFPDRYQVGSATFAATVLTLVAWGMLLGFVTLIAGVTTELPPQLPDPAICF